MRGSYPASLQSPPVSSRGQADTSWKYRPCHESALRPYLPQFHCFHGNNKHCFINYIDENKNNVWDWKENQSTSGGLTVEQVRDIVTSMIDTDNSGTADWEEHTTYYMTSEGDDGAWGSWTGE